MKKKLISVLTTLAVLCSAGLAACGDKTPSEEQTPTPEETVAHEHVWVEDASKEKTATCGEAGRKYYTCECGLTKTERTAEATGNHTDADGDGVCDDCGYVDMSDLTKEQAIEKYGYYLIDEDESGTYTTGDIVFFGSYPQKLINKGALDLDNATHIEESDEEEEEPDDEQLIAQLDALKGTLPTATDNGDWTSYGYYDEGVASDYMFYKDVELDGVKYRGVYLTEYRSYYARLATGTDYSYIDDEGYQLGTVYWFEYAPIRWIVLDYIDGDLFINSLDCLEAQPFQDLRDYDETDKEAYIPGTETYMNDWESCSLRAFLNGTFFNGAFTEAEQALVQSVTLNNQYTGYETDNEYQINQNNTTDKVFLLAWEDLFNTDYGFPTTMDFDDMVTKNGVDADSDEVAEGKIRRRGFSDYSTIQGLHRSTAAHTLSEEGACHYILRSAGITSYSICGITKYGSLWSSGKLSVTGTDSYDTYAGNGNLGVTPSLYIKVGK